MAVRWKMLAGITLMGSMFVMGGCSSGGGSGDKVKIGITQIVEHPSLDAAAKGFKKALADGGFKNASIDTQVAQGDKNNNKTIAENFVGDKVDLIFANSTDSAQSAVNATAKIPIVFTSVTDPIGAKLVESFEKPGGNVTGTTDTHPDAIPKTIGFIDKEFGAKKVGMIYNSGEQNSLAQIELVKKAMEGTDMEIVDVSVSTSAEVKQAAESLVGKADVFYIITDNTVVSALDSVVQVANDKDIPLFVGELDSVAKGGLAAYGFDYYDIGYQAGEMAVQILKGEKKPSELAVEYPKNLKLLINKDAAKEMGVELKPEWDEMAEYKE